MKNLRELFLDGASIVAAACAVVLTVLAFTRQTTATSASALAEEIDERTWNELTAGHRIGPEKARLVVVEFGDFECPACAAFARTFRRFQQVDPLDVALIFRHWPLSYH